MKLTQKLMSWIVPDLTTPRGNYHATMFTPENKPYKLFLIVDGQGLGTLVVNSATVVYLNQTSTDMVFHYIRGADQTSISRFIHKKYKHVENAAEDDFSTLLFEIEQMLNIEDQNPVSELNEGSTMDFGGKPRYGLLALDPIPRIAPPTVEVWKKAVDDLVADGYPHIVLVGTNTCEPPWMEELVGYTEEIGIVCGLVTEATIGDKEALSNLLRVGLDHLVLNHTDGCVIDPELVGWLNEQDVFYDIYLGGTSKRDELIKNVEEFILMGARYFSIPTLVDPSVTLQIQGLAKKVGGWVQTQEVAFKLNANNLFQSEIGWIVLADGKRYTT